MCRSSCATTWTLNIEYQTESTAFMAANVKHMARHVLVESSEAFGERMSKK